MQAADLKALVEDKICDILKDPVAILELAASTTVADRKAILSRAADLARRWQGLVGSERRHILSACLYRTEVRAKTVSVSVRPIALVKTIRDDKEHDQPEVSDDGSTIDLTVQARIKRTGLSNKLVIEGKAATTQQPNRSLLRLIARAQRFNALVMNNAGEKIGDIAATAGVSRSYFTRVLRLSFLAPEITKAIIQGRQPAEFSAIKLMRAGQFALRWSDQHRDFGLV